MKKIMDLLLSSAFRRWCLLFAMITICESLQAQPQSPGSLPQLLPQTPEAAQFMKTGLGNIDQSTGAARAVVPLYAFKVGSFEFPITLRYLCQGNKPEELCSRVGWGWSLAAGGVISRKVMGMPDERAPRPAPLSTTDLSAGTTQAVYDYLQNGKTDNGTSDIFDTQPDEFYYSFNGHSGKFILNDAGQPVVIQHENLSIVVNKTAPNPGVGIDFSTIAITTPDGVKYIFGENNAYDKTKSDGFLKGSVFPKTAFYLSSIMLPGADTISLSYNRITTRALAGFSETVSTPNPDQNTSNQCPQGHYIESRNFSFQDVTYDACYLARITTTTGITVVLDYEAMSDASGDKRLQHLAVYNLNQYRVSEYFFEYTNCAGVVNAYPTSPVTTATGINGRFFLTRVYQPFLNPDGGDLQDRIGYNFDYYDGAAPNGASSPYTVLDGVYAQDYFGFSNGKNNQSLLPRPAPPDDFPTTAIQWADKAPDAAYSIKGMLRKITYPTTGSDEFFYEPNTILSMEMIPQQGRVSHDMHGEGSSGYGSANIVNTFSDVFSVYRTNVATFNLTQSVETNCNAPCALCKTIFCTINDITDGTVVRNYTATGLNPIADTVTLRAGHNYRVEINISGPACFHAQMVLNYDATNPNAQPVNRMTGGVRVSRIRKNDPLTGRAMNKYYYYAALASLGSSSGQGLLKQEYRSSIKTVIGCEGWVCYHCGHSIYNSNGIYNLFGTNNSHVYYTDIIEADNALFSNGGIQYTYYPPSFSGGTIRLRGVDIPYAPENLNANYNGVLKKTTWFNQARTTLRTEENTYETVTSADIVRSIHIRRQYTDPAGITAPDPGAFLPFDVRESDYAPFWLRQTSKTVTAYENLSVGLQTVTTYTYGTKDNVLPREEKTTTSRQEEKKITRNYVSDNPFSDPVVSVMKTNYQIARLVQELTDLNGNRLTERRIQYKDWYNDGKVTEPYLILENQTGSTTLEDRIYFRQYDQKGNMTELSKAGGQPIVYLWDYYSSQVTAEIKNATLGQVAATSFESTGTGNWTLSGTPVSDPGAPTGKKVFPLTVPNAATKSGLGSSTSYIVSYWSNSGPQNVNGSPSTAGRSRNGWTYYEHLVLPAGGTISVSPSSTGSRIDELRLYPKGAAVTSFTCEPLVGITDQCDVDNHITYYEYDKLNRLRLIRDQDGNILKKICYNYMGQQANCGSPLLYYSQAQTVTLTRNNCGPGYTGGAYTYSLPTGAYTSSGSQAAADQLALSDINSKGQDQANANASCIVTGTAYFSLRNGFTGSGPFPIPVTILFIQGTTVVQTSSFSSSANGSVTVSVPSGTYKLRLQVKAGFENYTISYTIGGRYVEPPRDGSGSYTTDNIDFSPTTVSGAFIIRATNAQ